MKTRSLAAAMCAVASLLPLAASAAERATVVRDAETGALRAPTAAEAAALRGKPAAKTLRAPTASATAEAEAEVVVRKLDNGAIVADVPESLMQFSVVTRHADGTLTQSCVQGAARAAQMASKPQFAKPLSMSTARTARGMAYEVR